MSWPHPLHRPAANTLVNNSRTILLSVDWAVMKGTGTQGLSLYNSLPFDGVERWVGGVLGHLCICINVSIYTTYIVYSAELEVQEDRE